MPTPQQLDSLKALLGMGVGSANADYSRSALRQQQLQDPRTSASFQQLVGAEDVAEEEQAADDPIAQRYRDIGQAQNEALVYNMPERRAMREEDLAAQLGLKRAAAEEAGKAQIRSAEIAGPYRVSAAEATAQGKEGVATRGAETQTANRQAIALRQRLAALQKQGRPGWFGQLTGEGAKYDTELDQILQQLGIGLEEAVSPTGESEPSAAPPAPPGWQYVPKPGGGWTAIEMR